MIYIDFDSINGKFMKFVCEHSSFVSFLIPAKRQNHPLLY